MMQMRDLRRKHLADLEKCLSEDKPNEDGSMQTGGVHCRIILSDTLEDTSRRHYSGSCPTNDVEATAAVS
jgi:hypothetical protein